MDNDSVDQGDADAIDEFEQAYRAAASEPAVPADLDARIADLPDDPPPPRRRRRSSEATERDRVLATGGMSADLGPVVDAIARLEARIDRLEESVTKGGSVALVRTSHQSLGRKVDGHAGDVLAALDRIERRLDDMTPEEVPE